ncbi:hypothetical protein H5410_032309 [Solanum commersonii]|uniref:Retrovirus-related Pol polyprotein from transposon TNT 1-94 n=1 Tax=Solanum commersonii TaxID=4109 RepID=A0A9J5YJL9_SOLCO|nr:hypothetical protein H5410_032309 [Solanum commersonii]
MLVKSLIDHRDRNTGPRDHDDQDAIAIAIKEGFSKVLKETEQADLKERSLSVIFMRVTNSVLKEIAKEKYAATTWKKLEDLYSKKPMTNRLYLEKGYTISNVDIKIEIEDQNLIVLCSLPPSYDTFADTLIYGKDNISLDDVSNALTSKELEKNFPDRRTEGEEHNTDLNRKRFNARSKSRDRKQNYYECREQGEKGEAKVDYSTNIVDNGNNSDDIDFVGEVFAVSSNHRKNSWVLNSGDDNSLEEEGIGKINLRMFDGIIRNIEFWQFPLMKVISCLFRLWMIKGKLHSGLCYLQASEVEGEAIVASGKSDMNQSQLLLLRLGHMSDKGLSLLNKWNLLDDYINRALYFCEHCVFAETNHGVSDCIELEVESLLAHPNSSTVEEMQDINQDDNDDAPIQQQSYSIAIGRKKRVINQRKRFANVVTENLFRYENFKEFALSVAETIDVHGPNSYKEAISSSKVDRWVGAMGEKIESLQKNQTWKLGSVPRGQKALPRLDLCELYLVSPLEGWE